MAKKKKTSNKAPKSLGMVGVVGSDVSPQAAQDIKNRLDAVRDRELTPMTPEELKKVLEYANVNNGFYKYPETLKENMVKRPMVKYITPVYDSRQKGEQNADFPCIWGVHFYGGEHEISFTESHFGVLAPMPKGFNYKTLFEWVMAYLDGSYVPNDNHWEISMRNNQFTKASRENVIWRLNSMQRTLEQSAQIIAEVNKNFKEMQVENFDTNGTTTYLKLRVGNSRGYYKVTSLREGGNITTAISQEQYKNETGKY